MKNRILVALFILIAAFPFLAQAQDEKPFKLGYTNVNYIYSLSPKSKEIESEIKSRTTMLQKEIENKEKDFQEKLASYQKAQGNMLESIKADKENELRNLESSIMNLKKNAEAELKAKYEELVAPESDRISKAVKDVATENGFTYIINGDPQIVLYSSEKYDVTDLVLKKLGITPPAPGEKPGKSTDTPKGPTKVNSGPKKAGGK
jgi:outer membrane protein